MSVLNPDVVDAVGLETSSDVVVLSVLDGLEWSDCDDHLARLSKKLNHYLGFIESGELMQSYPDSEGRARRIEVVFKFSPPHSAIRALSQAATVVLGYECDFAWRVHA